MPNPWAAREHVHEFLHEALGTNRPDREGPVVVVSHPTAVTVALPWGGDEPGVFVITFVAEVDAEGNPWLRIESSDELPPTMRRDRLRVEG